MKKIISILLLWCLSLNVMASSGTIRELQKAFDDYSYAMTVEWDQKDKSFADKATQGFLEQLKKLVSEKGLGKEEVKLLLASRIQDPEMVKMINVKAELMGPDPSAETVLNFLKSSSEEIYHQGASWNGDVQVIALVGVVVAIFAVLIAKSVWWENNHHCTQYDEAEECTEYYDCHGDFCNYSGTSCGIITRCTKYERNE